MGPSVLSSQLHQPSTKERQPLLWFPSSTSRPPPGTGGVAGPAAAANLDHDQEVNEREYADSNGLYPPNLVWTAADAPAADPFRIGDCHVYTNIHRIRRDILTIVDDPYSLDQLKTPRLNILVVRPLVDEYYATQDLSVVYCLLVNQKILRRYNENSPGPKGLLKLANILVAGFEPFQNAPEEIIQEAKDLNPHHSWSIRDHGADDATAATADSFGKLTALEVAIITESKSFLASNACQKVIDAIYKGKVVYSPNCNFAIISDLWKHRPISLYDPCRAPILNQYRLNVPRIRAVLEVFQFVILLALYMMLMEAQQYKTTPDFSVIEVVFDVYTVGWVLNQFAIILEHGWQVYTQNLWSFLDVMFSTLFLVYLSMRLYGRTVVDEQLSADWALSALDVLCCGAPLLVPRLAFNLMAENMLFVSLRAMMSDFFTLTILAVWCFVGFLLSLKWLDNGNLYNPFTISKWIIWIWFGLDGTGIDRAPDFHWLLGPILMVSFAFLGNTLFLTILVSMLTNTFSNIVNNAAQEIQYRRAVRIFEGVHFDAIFAYMPPFNLLALVVLLPLRMVLTPHLFHTVNVACTRALNFPILLFISWYERRTLWVSDKRNRLWWSRVDWNSPFGPRARSKGSWWTTPLKAWKLSRFSLHGALQIVFDLDPPDLSKWPSRNSHQEGSGEDESNSNSKSRTKGKAIFNPRQRALSTLVIGDFTDPFSLNSFGRPPLVVPEQEQKQKQKEKGVHQKKEEVFRDSGSETDDHEEGSDGDAGEGADRNKRDQKRPWRAPRSQRLDSITDMHQTDGSGAEETNARLYRLEESLQRIEAMIAQLANKDSQGSRNNQNPDSDPDSETEEMKLESQIATGTVPA